MGETYLIDRNAVTDYLMGKLPPNGMKFMAEVVNDIPHISVITQIEVLSFKTSNSSLIRDFISASAIFDLEESIVRRTIALRR
jgi:predicted nucleic acid-binding protein